MDSMDREAITVVQYMLSPDVPKSERKHFEKYYMMFSKIMALGNIKREEVLAFIIGFKKICLLLEAGLFETARQSMAKQIMKMQLSRSIGGFHTIWTSGGYSRQEQIAETIQQLGENKKSSRVKRFFGSNKK